MALVGREASSDTDHDPHAKRFGSADWPPTASHLSTETHDSNNLNGFAEKQFPKVMQGNLIIGTSLPKAKAPAGSLQPRQDQAIPISLTLKCFFLWYGVSNSELN
jgi:hypothetical protein